MGDWFKPYTVESGHNFEDLKTNKKYKIPDHKIRELWELYCWNVALRKRQHLAEVTGTHCVVHESIRLLYHNDVEEGLPVAFIRSVVYVIQQTLLENTTTKDSELLCAVIRGNSKSNANRDFYLRVQFPLACMDVQDQKEKLAPIWKKKLSAMNPLQYLEAQTSGEIWENEFPGKPWLMFGGTIPGSDVKFEFDRFYEKLSEDELYDTDPPEISLNEVFHPKDSELVSNNDFFKREMFYKKISGTGSSDGGDSHRSEDSRSTRRSEDSRSTRRSEGSTSRTSRSGKKEESSSNASSNESQEIVEEWLPFFLSIHFPRRKTQLKIAEEPKHGSETSSFAHTDSEKVEDSLGEIRELCRLIPHAVRTSDVYRNKIGRICWYHSQNEKEEGFKLWQEIMQENFSAHVKREDDDDDDLDDEKSTASDFSDQYSYSKIWKTAPSVEEDTSSETASKLAHRKEDEEDIFPEAGQMDDYQKVWSSFRMDKYTLYTLKSLQYLVMQEERRKLLESGDKNTPKNYDEWLFFKIISKNTKILDNVLNSNYLDSFVAKLFYTIYPYKFIWMGKTWWSFDEHRWIKDKKDTLILKHLGTAFVHKLEAYKKKLLTLVSEASAPYEDANNQVRRLEYETQIKKIDGLCNRLGTMVFKKKIREELKLLYDWEGVDFNDIRDENPNLLVCTNCVVEFINEKTIDRIGLPEDFCSYTTKIRYLKKVNPRTKREIKKYFCQVYPDEEIRIWMWRYWTSGLRRGNPDKNFVIHRGTLSGDNSKSQMIKLVCGSFGQYAIKGKNEELLANVRRSASGAEPEKIRKRGRCWVFYQEVDGKEPLRGGFIRDVSGGDTSGGARDNYEGADDMVDTQQGAKHSVMLNKLPPIAEGGSVGALWLRRLKVIDYEAHFSEDAPKDPKEQWEKRIFPIDEDFEDRLPEWYETFLSMLISMWKDYYKAKPRLPQSEKIKQAVRKWHARIDFYLNFVTEAIKIHNISKNTPDPSKKVSVASLYAHFRTWYGNTCGKNAPSRSTFTEEMQTKGLIFEGSNYIGISLVTGSSHVDDYLKKDVKKEDDDSDDEKSTASRVSKEDFEDDEE